MYRVYVVQLSAGVRTHGRVRAANPDGGESCFYVGSTAHDAEHRYSQHKAGIHANRGYVTKYGEGLRPDLSDGVEYSTRAEAEDAEARIASQLRAAGHTVWSN